MKKITFIGLTLVAALSLFGCQQVNDMVNKAANTNTATNSNATANANVNNSANQSVVNSTSTPVVPVATPKEDVVKADASKREMPSAPQLQEMTKKALLDFNKAVKDDDFTDFHNTVASPWKKQTSPSDLKTSFQGFIDKKIDISNISALEAAFSPDPIIRKELGYETLILKGNYPTTPNSTKFLLHFIPDGKDWKLSRIEVDTTSD